jgi:hypothetical protein
MWAKDQDAEFREVIRSSIFTVRWEGALTC